jgi:transposase-like protein
MKIICPECGGQLKYWNEYYFYKSQKINPNTGKPNKTITKGKSSDDCDHEGFKCLKCGWTFNTINDSYDEIEYLGDWLDQHREELKV